MAVCCDVLPLESVIFVVDKYIMQLSLSLYIRVIMKYVVPNWVLLILDDLSAATLQLS